MSGDYSRWRFDPADDHDGVLLQQGRLLTDADWNEGVAIGNRRLQATRRDIFGPAAVVPLTTPDGFKLGLDPNLGLTIGPGRIYIDGLLVECHGLSPAAWDAALAEPVGTAAIPYSAQPYYPEAPTLPATGGPFLIYLDAWTRELTAVEAPDLVEPALGVDTTTRWQTAWQVRWLDAGSANGSGLGCDTDAADIPGWLAVTAPSSGRLSTGTAAFGTDSPCLVPPSGGYTGLENQLYRIQIHQGGAPGTASFVWSRDDASVVAGITQIVGPTTLVVDSLGKDAVLGFHAGDWVEVLDDRLELNGQPGELHRIAVGDGVDSATRRITLETPLAGSFVAGVNHLRLVRWDQSGQVLRTDTVTPSLYLDLDAVGATGDIPVPADGTVTIALETGIVASFDLASAGGQFRSGDAWLFAARASTASIEVLAKAAPRGIHHHYARLGIYTPGSPPTDCRQFWPPIVAGSDGCACTVCVSPAAHAKAEPSLQQAIDQMLAVGGGTVCLEAGVYRLQQPLKVSAGTGTAISLTLSGQGDSTRIVASGAGALFATGGVDLAVESLQILCEAATGALFTAISVADATAVRLQALQIVGDPAVPNLVAVSLTGQVTRAQVLDCDIAAAFGIATRNLADATGAQSRVFVADLHIADNRLACGAAAVDMSIDPKLVPVVRLLRNQVRAGALGIRLGGGSDGGGTTEISGNRVSVANDGIVVDLHGARILENDVAWSGGDATAPGRGIVVASNIQFADASAGNCRIVGNRLDGFPAAAITVTTPLTSTEILQNQITRCGSGILVGGTIALGDVAIVGNQVADLDAVVAASKPALLAGISVLNVQQVRVAGNAVARLGAKTAPNKFTMVAVLVQRCTSVRVEGNALRDIGPQIAYSGTVLGVCVSSPAGSLHVEGNRVAQTVLTEQVPPAPTPSWLGIVVIPQEAVFGSAFATLTNAVGDISIAALSGLGVGGSSAPGAVLAPAATIPIAATAVVLRNDVVSRRTQPAILVLAGSCDFSNNQCLRDTLLGDAAGADVLLSTNRALVVGGNHVIGPKGAASIRLVPPGNSFTVIGNITSGGIQVQAAGLPPAQLGLPWEPLNVYGP